MIVRPDEISANRAPSTTPLNICETKLLQLITLQSVARNLRAVRPLDINAGCPRRLALYKRPGRKQRRRLRALDPAITRQKRSLRVIDADRASGASGVVAEMAAERVRLLHQTFTRHDFEDFPV